MWVMFGFNNAVLKETASEGERVVEKVIWFVNTQKKETNFFLKREVNIFNTFVSFASQKFSSIFECRMIVDFSKPWTSLCCLKCKISPSLNSWKGHIS